MVISISNYKGGTGKTTSTANIGYLLSTMGYKVLLIDSDPQFNLTTLFSPKEHEHTLFGVLTRKEKIKPLEVRKNLYLLPSELELARAEIAMAMQTHREYKLDKALKAVKDNFDFVLIDCAPSLGLVTINSYFASDLIFVPVECEYFSYGGLKVLERALDDLEMDIDRFFATKYDGRKILHQQVWNKISKDKRSFKTPIRTNVSAAESVGSNQTVIEYAPKSNAAIDYISLTNEIVKYVKAQKSK